MLVIITANLDAVAVAVHAEPAAARDATRLHHRLEMRHVLHVLVHVGRQHLQPNLCGGYNYDSTLNRLSFDCNTTDRATIMSCYDRSLPAAALRPKYINRSSCLRLAGRRPVLRRCDVNDLDKQSNDCRTAVKSKSNGSRFVVVTTALVPCITIYCSAYALVASVTRVRFVDTTKASIGFG